jgi:hypothetical protein
LRRWVPAVFSSRFRIEPTAAVTALQPGMESWRAATGFYRTLMVTVYGRQRHHGKRYTTQEHVGTLSRSATRQTVCGHTATPACPEVGEPLQSQRLQILTRCSSLLFTHNGHPSHHQWCSGRSRATEYGASTLSVGVVQRNYLQM